jgi:hypothetical protein
LSPSGDAEVLQLGAQPIPDDYRFEDFWAAYPTRDTKKIGKADALKVWRRLSYDEKRAAYAGVAHYAEACQTGVTRAKDAHRWLTKREWVEWQTPAVPDVMRTTARATLGDHNLAVLGLLGPSQRAVSG